MKNKPITQLSYEELADISEENAEIIRTALLSYYDAEDGDRNEIMNELVKEIVSEMKLSIRSMAPLYQRSPTNFHIMFIEEVLKYSEGVKRKRAAHIGYDVEKDIRETRKQVEAQLAAAYKTELTLRALLKNRQYDQALTIVHALELERKNKDLALRFEVLNWKLNVLSLLGSEQGFFETLQEMINLSGTNSTDIRYDPATTKECLLNLLSTKLTKGIPMQFNHFGWMEVQKDCALPARIGKAFEELLITKISEEIMAKRTIKTAKDFNDFLSKEWNNIASSFKLINPYVENVPKPFGIG